MKVKNSIIRKILPSILIAVTLEGWANTTTFALDNSSIIGSTNEVSMFSKEETQKILKQMSRTRGIIKYYNTSDKNYVLIKYGGHLYLFNLANKQLIKGLFTVGGDTFYFSTYDGTAQTGWYNVKDSGERNGRYYFRTDTCTAYKQQFQTIGNERFYFDGYGRIETGLFRTNGYTYYGNAPTGVIVTGWKTINGKRYYFDPMRNGAAKTGWYQDGSAGKMYFHNDGTMASGVNKINGETYLFKPHGKGKNCYITNGFYTDISTGYRYLFAGPDGEAYTGWYKNPYTSNNEAQGWMYFNKNDGVMANGWTIIDGKKYLFQSPTGSGDTYPKIGWYNDGFLGYGYTYYFDPNDKGAAVTSSYKVIDGKEYVFDISGVLQYNGGKHPTE